MANRTKWTRITREEFIAELAKSGNVAKAAKKIGLSRSRVYELRDVDKKFADEWNEAIETGIDNLEEEARRRAYNGTLKPVFYQGSKCGSVREYSDTLMVVLLKAHRPEKYKERVQNEVTGKNGEPLPAAVQIIAIPDNQRN
ncbi:MAG: terminase [Pseudomonadota bacterium]|nr:terminase [Pseudomonadota bacterium]